MDFYVDIAVAVFLRLLKDRRSFEKYATAIAKVYVALGDAIALSPILQKAVEAHDAKRK